MNESEARQIVGRLTSSFPSARLAADNIAAYVAWIVKYDYAIAADAVIQLVGNLKRWPTLADFDDAARDASSRRRARTELEEPRRWPVLSAAERESGKAYVASAVETLKKAHQMPREPRLGSATVKAPHGSGQRYRVDDEGNAEPVR